MPFRKILNGWKRFFLNLASGIYSSLGGLRVKFYQWGIFRTRRLPVPVICVGDLILGGSGKTPTVIALAEHFQNEGYQVAALCSGYKKNKPRKITVVSEGQGPTVGPHEGGDEAVLIARRLPGVRVLSGRDRYGAGKIAIEKFKANLLILDGGYQHLGLARDTNILLVTPDLFSAKIHPSQILRERLSGIRRAGLCLLTKVKNSREEEEVKKRIRKIAPGVPIFSAPLVSECLVGPEGKTYPPSFLKNKRVMAFAGVADGNTFCQQLEELGTDLNERIFFSNHFAYSSRSFKKILQRARKAGVELLVGTEKDFEKVSHFYLGEEIPLLFLRIQIKIPTSEGKFFDFLDAKIGDESCREFSYRH